MKRYRIIHLGSIIGTVVLLFFCIIWFLLGLLTYYQNIGNERHKDIFGLINCILSVMCCFVSILLLFTEYEIADEEKITQYKYKKQSSSIYWTEVQEIYVELVPIRLYRLGTKNPLKSHLKIKNKNGELMDIRIDKKTERIIRKFYKGKINGLDDLPK